jgi:hypothetical protein
MCKSGAVGGWVWTDPETLADKLGTEARLVEGREEDGRNSHIDLTGDCLTDRKW